MKLNIRFSLITLTLLMGLSACGKKTSFQAINDSVSPAIGPINIAPSTPVSDFVPGQQKQVTNAALEAQAPNVQVGAFKVDNSLVNQWQAKAVAASNGAIYVAVGDTQGLSKKGSVIKMNAADGKNWTDLGSKYLGLSHPIDKTIMGIAVYANTIVAVDTNSKSYIVDATKSGNIKVLKTSGGNDIASTNAGNIFISNGNIEKSDVTLSSRTPISISASGGIGADNFGNIYAVSGNTIKKSDSKGVATDFIKTGLISPIDVAVDNRNSDVYVLETASIKRFNASGQLLCTFACGAVKPVSLAIDESGSLYVADAGTASKDSKIVKFTASAFGRSTIVNNNQDQYNSDNNYNNYSNY